MSNRIIDGARQGIAAPQPALSAPRDADPVSVEQARAAVAGWREQGMPLFGLHQVAVALAGEVDRLRGGDEAARHDIERLLVSVASAEAEVDRLRAEFARYRAALPEIIGCAHREGAECRRDDYGFHPCCATRLRVTRHGLSPQFDRWDELGDGA